MKRENTKITCPDCRGALERIEDGGIVQYRCRVGHLYSAQSAVAAHATAVENALWAAVVGLEEGADLDDDVAQIEKDGDSNALHERAKIERAAAQTIRNEITRVLSDIGRA